MAKTLPLFSSEYELAKAITQGDTKAQRLLYEQYSPKMMAICGRYMNDEMEAEDVMIEGFMKIFDKIKQFNYQGSFEGWMKKIMVNEALMRLRSRKMIKVDIDEIKYHKVDEDVSYDLNVQELLKLINALPVGYRTIFNLYAIEGYSHAEIAEQLQITEGTSKSQLSRARSLLQEQIKMLESENSRKLNK